MSPSSPVDLQFSHGECAARRRNLHANLRNSKVLRQNGSGSVSMVDGGYGAGYRGLGGGSLSKAVRSVGWLRPPCGAVAGDIPSLRTVQTSRDRSQTSAQGWAACLSSI